MIKANHSLIKGEKFSQGQIDAIVEQFLSDRNPLGQAGKDKKGMSPLFYLPPDNGGKKLKTVFGQVPKTRLFSANMSELETLRLLAVFAPQREEVRAMVAAALDRLKTACFGLNDGVGECFDTSLVALRFLIAAAPEEKEWIQSRMENYTRHRGDKKRPWFSKWYYWLCLSELPFDAAYPEFEKDKGEMLNWLANRGFVMNGEQDRLIHPVLACMLRNILSNYPEYAYIKGRQPYISDKDGRLYLDMENFSGGKE